MRRWLQVLTLVGVGAYMLAACDAVQGTREKGVYKGEMDQKLTERQRKTLRQRGRDQRQ